MAREVTEGGRRRIIRRRGNGNGGDPAANGNGNTDNGTDANRTSTVSGGDRDDSLIVTINGNSPIGETESNGFTFDLPRDENKRVRGGNGGSVSRDDDGGTDDGDGDGGTDDGGSNSARRRTGEGKPRRIKRHTAEKPKDAVLLKQDEEDLNNILIAIGDAAAVGTGFDGFKIEGVEAATISRPAARILQRHGAIAETIRTVADPLALIVAAASVIGPRVAAYNFYRKHMMQPTTYEQPPSDEQQTQPNKVTNLKDYSFTQQFQQEN